MRHFFQFSDDLKLLFSTGSWQAPAGRDKLFSGRSPCCLKKVLRNSLLMAAVLPFLDPYCKHAERHEVEEVIFSRTARRLMEGTAYIKW